jgi:hypothetical protein
MTTIPIDLKNRGACRDRAKEADPNDRRANIGNVPRAKKSIIVSHPINDPLDSAAICIDCVNPQGRKKVPIPISIGIKIAPHFFLKTQKKELVSVRVFLNIPARLRPRNIITREAMIQSIAEKRKFIPIAFPIIPSIPPKRAKPNILALWKRIIGLFP